MNSKQILQRCILVTALVCLAPPTLALDTDIYLKPPKIARDDAPNVLIVIDTSESMEESVSNAANYDATKNYCDSVDNPSYNGGACFDRNRIYWRSDGVEPTDTNTNLWFSSANNECYASQGQLGSTAGATGKFSDHVTGWIVGNNSRGKWGDLVAGTDHAYVECRADRGDHGPNGATRPDNKYANEATSIASPYAERHTANTAKEYNWSRKFTLYSGNYLNFRKYPPAGTVQKRIEVAKQAVKTLIDSSRGVRFGLMTFNRNWDGAYSCGDKVYSCENGPPHGGRVLMKVDAMTDARRDEMKFLVDNLSTAPDGIPQSSPLSETLYEAYLYLAGKPVKYGDDHEQYEGASSVPPRDLAAEKDGTELKGGTYISPFAYQCQQSYVIFVSDGAPQMDTDADAAIQDLAKPSSSCGTADPNYDFADGKSCLDELAGYMYNNDLVSNLTGTQRVLTYTVGFANGLSSAALQLLKDTAKAGHGRYYDATDATNLASALQSAIIDIQVTNASFAAPSLSVNAFNKLFNRDEVYFALFKPSTTVAWDGNVKKYKLCADTTNASCTFGEVIDANDVPAIDTVNQRIKDTAVSYWGTTADGGTVKAGGAGAHVPAADVRNVYTYTGGYPIASPPVDLSTHPLKDANTAITAAMLGLPSTATAADRTNLINWIRGQDVYDSDGDGNTTENRWGFADPLHSRPVAVTFGGGSTNPVIKLFAGTNEGTVRMINDATGKEEWAFIPPELLEMQYALSQDADNVHPVGMDGAPSFWIVDNNKNGIIEPGNGDKVYMYIGMRRGGRNIYAFDVTPTNTLSDPTVSNGVTPKLLWVIRGGVDTDYAKLGQTWSQPMVARIRYGISTTTKDSEFKTVLIFGGGYDPNQDDPVWAGTDTMGNAIYIAEPLTGARFWWASDGASGANLELTGMDFSIPSDLALMDPEGDGAVDRIYVGDMAGQLWRIDLNPALKSTETKASIGFRLADIACTGGSRPDCTDTPAQNRRKFFFPPDVAQVDDSTYETADQATHDLVVIGSGDREDPLDYLTYGATTSVQPVNNRIYAFRDYKVKNLVVAGEAAPTTPITEAAADETVTANMTNKVYNATANNVQSSDKATADSALALIQAGSGWYINLQDTTSTKTFNPWIGEKVLAKAVIFNGAIYATTYTPASDETAAITCVSSEGLAKLYTLGLGAGTPIADTNGDGNVTTADRAQNLGGGIPSELITVIRESGTSALVGTSGGAATPKIDSHLPRFKTFWYEE